MPKDSCKNGAGHCLFIPILIAVMLMLFLIVYLLAQKYFSSSSSSEQQGYTIALSLTCFIAGIIIVALILNSIKEACYGCKLTEWSILSINIEEDQDREVLPDEERKLEEMRNKILVLPSTLKVKGRKVRVPEVRPSMTPVHQNGRIVAFSPKFYTPVGCHRSNITELNPINDTFFNFSNFDEARNSFSELIKK